MSTRRNNTGLHEPVDDPDAINKKKGKKAKDNNESSKQETSSSGKESKSIKTEQADDDKHSSPPEKRTDQPNPDQANNEGAGDQSDKSSDASQGAALKSIKENDQFLKMIGVKPEDEGKPDIIIQSFRLAAEAVNPTTNKDSEAPEAFKKLLAAAEKEQIDPSVIEMIRSSADPITETSDTEMGEAENTSSQKAGSDGHKSSRKKDRSSRPKAKTRFKKERRGSNDKSLFIPESEKESDSGEDDSQYDSEYDSEHDPEHDPEYGRPLFSRPGPQIGDDVTTVGWTGGRSRLYINQHGPKNAARHRLEIFAESAEYEDTRPKDDLVTNITKRYGDKRLPNGTFQYTKRHILAIYGVAWEGAGTGDPAHDLDLINPNCVGKRWPITYVLIAWDVDGTTRKNWEPRQALRARWRRKVADKAIFEAACEAEDRYQEVLSGKRVASSRSPSVGLVRDTTRKYRDMSLGALRSSPTPPRTKKTTPRAKSRFTDSDSDTYDLAKKLEEFRLDYCECAGVESFRDLDPTDKADFVQAWRHAKAE